MNVPPVAFGSVWILGQRLPTPLDGALLTAATLTGNGLVLAGFVVTTLMLPIMVFGSAMDRGIG